MKLMSRRRLLGSAALIAAAAATGRAGAAATSNGATTLPARGTFIIRNAYVMTMDEAGDHRRRRRACRQRRHRCGRTRSQSAGRCRDRRSRHDRPAGAGRDPLAYVEYAAAQHVGRQAGDTAISSTTALLGQKFEPGDMYQGTRLACAEAINNGITHVHDWCHNIRGPDYAEADLKALRESGLRARFSYGCVAGHGQ